jgi:hypothetical protein
VGDFGFAHLHDLLLEFAFLGVVKPAGVVLGQPVRIAEDEAAPALDSQQP